MNLKLDRNFKDFETKLTKLKNETPKKLSSFMKLQGESLKATVKNFTPVDTGSLKGGWHRRSIQGNPFAQILYNDVGYVNHVEFGHRVGRKNFIYKPGVYMLKRAVSFREKEFYTDLEKAFIKELKK